MNAVVKAIRSQGALEQTIYLKPTLTAEGRRLRRVQGWFHLTWLALTGRLIVIKLYKNNRALIRLCPVWCEPELLRQLLAWVMKKGEPKLIIKNFTDTVEMKIS